MLVTEAVQPVRVAGGERRPRGRQAQAGLFRGQGRLTMNEAIEMTAASVRAWGEKHDHWSIAWSGGKDSTATLTLLIHLIREGAVPRPRSLTVLYADTRQELPPLYAAALGVMERLRELDMDVRICRAPLDKRFLVYMLGRGVPPPNNNTLRWCTRQIKVDPMAAALESLLDDCEASVLTITGVRQGESAIRDRRIEMSCGKDGAECGQGWYQEVLPNAKGVRGRIATLAPLLHWRVCHVWDWLKFFAPEEEFGGFPTAVLADAYGGEEAEEVNARTGCIGCPLASQEKALDTILRNPAWSYLEPLKEIKRLYRTLRQPKMRLRKTGVELLKDGSIAANPQRMGPLTLEARRMALAQVLSIQRHCNVAARRLNRPKIDILNAEEETRIRELIAMRTWPQGWDGAEPRADTPLDRVFQDGSVQPRLV